jgi:hypothetical protein
MTSTETAARQQPSHQQKGLSSNPDPDADGPEANLAGHTRTAADPTDLDAPGEGQASRASRKSATFTRTAQLSAQRAPSRISETPTGPVNRRDQRLDGWAGTLDTEEVTGSIPVSPTT